MSIILLLGVISLTSGGLYVIMAAWRHRPHSNSFLVLGAFFLALGVYCGYSLNSDYRHEKECVEAGYEWVGRSCYSEYTVNEVNP